MFFNYDSFELGAIAFVVSGILIYYYSGYSVVPHAKVNNSLLNTKTTSDLSNNLATNISNSTLETTAPATHSPTLDSISNLPIHNFVNASVQTNVNIQVEAIVEPATTYVNTGMQTSPRMWLESIRNWINEILGITPTPQYRDVGVQTGAKSLWQLFKESINKFYNLETNSVSTPNQVRVDTWMSRLNSNQSVDLHDSESPLTNLRFGKSSSELQNLVNPIDSASNTSHLPVPVNVGEVVSESNLQNVVENKVYDITDPGVLNLYMQDETIDFEVIENVHYAVTDNISLSIDPSIINFLI
jgi:hypothetical protein